MRLKKKWTAGPQPHSDVLVEEIDLALKHIHRKI